MEIKASDVAKLRSMTGAGMMAAKKALTEAEGDFDKAVDLLRKSGAAKAAKKTDRETSEGRVHCYMHSNGKIGVVVEVLCETDFVARNEDFVDFCNDVALHIAAMSPRYTKRDEVPADALEKEREVIMAQLKEEGKPEDMIEKITEGKLNKFYEEVVLLEQKFVKDEDMTIEALVQSKIQSLGENIQLGRFSRIELGA